MDEGCSFIGNAATIGLEFMWLDCGTFRMSESCKMHCAKCHIEVEVIPDADGRPASVRCPRCGENDSIENAMLEIRDYLARPAAKEPIPSSYRFIPG